MDATCIECGGAIPCASHGAFTPALPTRDWLHDEHGKVRKSLYTLDAKDIERLAADIDARKGPLSPPCTFDVRQGDELLLLHQYRETWGADWVTVVRVDRNPIMGVGFLCQAPDGTGGFTRPDMFAGWRRRIIASEAKA